MYNMEKGLYRSDNMDAYFSLNQPRRIISANYITMVNPTLHPDRILTEHDLLYILDGIWDIAEEYEDGSDCHIMTLHSDDLLLLPAGRHHYGISPCSPNNRHMYIHVSPFPEEMDANLCRNYTADSQNDSLHRFNSLIHCQNNPHIRILFQEIIAKNWEYSSMRNEKLSLLLNLLFCEAAEQQNKTVQINPAKDIVSEATRLIQTTPQAFFTGKELADRFYVCERTLTNQFRKVHGKTLYAYQMDIKLEMVRQFLITQPDIKLHETALNFGFCDEFHLSKTFRKKYGISPSQYRIRNS